MRIAFDYRIFSLQDHGGVSRYITELATHLAQEPNTDVRILAFAHINEYLQNCPPGMVVGRRVPKIPYVAEVRHALDALLSGAWLTARPPEILHPSYYGPYDFVPKRSKLVVTVHDMIHEKFSQTIPANDPTTRWKTRSVQRADHVICVSENTRRDLLERIAVDPAKVSVVPHGIPRATPAAPADVSPCETPYLLFLGGRDGPYKNFAGLLRAYAASADLVRDFGLLCFGGGAFSLEEHERFHQLGLPEGRMRHMSGSDAELARCYKHAALFVYPSLYEGFGLPPLEAMAQGCPVACSNTSSLPEVVGDAALLFDPAHTDSIVATIRNGVYFEQTRHDLKRRGQERATQFTWERCAQQTLACYRAAL